jgi:hypothetical protein
MISTKIYAFFICFLIIMMVIFSININENICSKILNWKIKVILKSQINVFDGIYGKVCWSIFFHMCRKSSCSIETLLPTFNQPLPKTLFNPLNPNSILFSFSHCKWSTQIAPLNYPKIKWITIHIHKVTNNSMIKSFYISEIKLHLYPFIHSFA